MSKENPYYKELVIGFRSILNSMKGPGRIPVLLQDYKSLYGKNIDYHKLGFGSLRDFFQNCPEFLTENHGNEMLIYARPSGSSVHLTQMVARQKVSKKSKMQVSRRSKPPTYNTGRPPISRPAVRPTSAFSRSRFPAVNYSSINNPSNYTGYHRNVPTVVRTSATAASTLPSLLSITTTRPTSKDSNNINVKSLNGNTTNSITSNNNNKTIKTENYQNFEGRISRTISNEHAINRNIVDSKAVIDKTNIIPTKSQDLRDKLNDKNSKAPSTDEKEKRSHDLREKLMKRDSVKPSNISDRLQVHKTTSNSTIPDLKLEIKTSAPVVSTQTKTPPITPSAFHWDMKNSNEIELLKSYAKHMGISPPVFKCIQCCKSTIKRIYSRVTIDNVVYSTYPDDFNTEIEANLAVAKRTIELLKKVEFDKKYPICLEPDRMVVRKIYELLRENENGLFKEAIPEYFIKAYEYSLPENWYEIVLDSKNLFSWDEYPVLDKIILFAKKPESDSSSDLTSNSDIDILDKIELPWDEEYWNLGVRHVVSTNEIWASLIGDEYSRKMEALTTDIELFVLNDSNKKLADTVKIGNIYLVCIMQCWSRVRVVDKNDDDNYHCFLIDIGDTEILHKNEIYVCDKNFLKLPAQAVRFALSEFDDFEVKPEINNYLAEILVNKILVGKITTQIDEYEAEENDDNDEPSIRAIFYDTSTEDDINMNDIFLKKVCDEIPSTSLRVNKIIHTVNVTCVRDDGYVFCQLKDNPNLNFITKRIQHLMKSKDLKCKIQENLRNNNVHIRKDVTYLVYDVKEKKYYRAAVDETFYKMGTSDIFKMNYIDYGFQRSVSILNICTLEDLDVALYNLPPQGIKVRLYNIPDLNENVIQSIRGLLQHDTSAMLKVVAVTNVPEVEIIIRVQPGNRLFTVNDNIRIENEYLHTNVEIDCEYLANTQINSKNDYSLLPPPPKDYPLENSQTYFDVHVTIASNPQNFIVQPYNVEDKKNFYDLMIELKNLYDASEVEKVHFDDILVGQAYLVKLKNYDDFVYRVVIETICSSALISAYACDIGEHVILTVEELRVLPEKFRALPKQAIKGRIGDIKPKHGDWTPDDVIRFQGLTVTKKFVASIIRKNRDGSYDLSLIDTSGEDDIEIMKILIEEGRAIQD